MKHRGYYRPRPLRVVLVAIILGFLGASHADEPKTAASQPSEPPKEKPAGAQLYAINCTRCHAERYPTEFTSGQWETVMLHMRVRANLPAKQAREILDYLKTEAGH